MDIQMNFDLEKGDNEHFTIELEDSITFREINRVLKTKDRWIRLQPRKYKGSKNYIDVAIVTRGLWGGFHRGIIHVLSDESDTEYIINLFVSPKKASSIVSD